MGTPEDVATENYFTPPGTLTDMLRNMYCSLDSQQMEDIKNVFKAWLQEVAIGKETPETELMRKTLILLVDEPTFTKMNFYRN